MKEYTTFLTKDLDLRSKFPDDLRFRDPYSELFSPHCLQVLSGLEHHHQRRNTLEHSGTEAGAAFPYFRREGKDGVVLPILFCHWFLKHLKLGLSPPL